MRDLKKYVINVEVVALYIHEYGKPYENNAPDLGLEGFDGTIVNVEEEFAPTDGENVTPLGDIGLEGIGASSSSTSTTVAAAPIDLEKENLLDE